LKKNSEKYWLKTEITISKGRSSTQRQKSFGLDQNLKSLPEHIPATQRVEKFIYAFARLQILKNLPIDSKTSKK